MILPSKELLSAVYGTKITRCDNKINDFKNELYFESEQYGHGEYIKFYVNINQISQVMKKWALSKGFYVLSMIDELAEWHWLAQKKKVPYIMKWPMRKQKQSLRYANGY